jgi:type II secretory pathway pseudopilin PulG
MEKREQSMSLFAIAKTKVSGNVKEAFKNEEGAIDLASIMVGIIVIGLIGGVIAATVFAVIPWAQNNAAKQQLDSISSAQSAYIGLSADKGNSRFGGNFVTSGTLPEGGFGYTYTKGASIGGDAVVTEKLFDVPATSQIAVGRWGSGTGAHYGAAAKSASGTIFYITDSKTQPTDNSVTPATAEVGAILSSLTAP